MKRSRNHNNCFFYCAVLVPFILQYPQYSNIYQMKYMSTISLHWPLLAPLILQWTRETGTPYSDSKVSPTVQIKEPTTSIVEIDRYIGLPIFFPIFKHFTIIGYRFCKKKISVLILIFFFFFFYIYIFFLYIHNYTEYNQQWNFDPSKYTHTWSSFHSGNAPVRSHM